MTGANHRQFLLVKALFLRIVSFCDTVSIMSDEESIEVNWQPFALLVLPN